MITLSCSKNRYNSNKKIMTQYYEKVEVLQEYEQNKYRKLSEEEKKSKTKYTRE